MKKPKAPKLVTVAIFTTITVVFWVFFTVYNILITTPAAQVPPELLDPLDPTLNTKVLETLPNETYYEEGEVILPPYKNIGEGVVTPTPSAAPTAIQELDQEPADSDGANETATGSGETSE